MAISPPLSPFFFIHYLEKPTKKNLWLAGIIFGVAQLTKYSVFLLIPFFIVIAVFFVLLKLEKSKIRNALLAMRNTIIVIIIGYIFVVWPVYYFHTWNYPPELQQTHTKELLTTYGNRNIAEPVIYLANKPAIRGLAEYGLGLLMVTQRSVGGNTTYFMGEVRNWAWKEYFPVVYFLKEPLAFWGLLILTWLIWSARIKVFNPKSVIRNCLKWSQSHFTELTMLLWIAVYWYTSITSNLNIGVRHLMPIYGFTFILLSGALVKVCANINSKKLLATYYILLTTLFGWYLCENLKIYPYYLTYFNQVALLRLPWIAEEQAGYIPGGHNYVVDSNLDWGQDLKRLAWWVEKNDIKKINFDYFGWADQSYYLGNNFNWIWRGRYASAEDFLRENPNGGYIAVSASFYMGSLEDPETSYTWLENYELVTTIGNSIFVWYIPPLK